MASTYYKRVTERLFRGKFVVILFSFLREMSLLMKIGVPVYGRKFRLGLNGEISSGENEIPPDFFFLRGGWKMSPERNKSSEFLFLIDNWKVGVECRLQLLKP